MVKYLLAMTLASALLLTGCGKEDSGTSSTPSTPSSTRGSGTLDAVKQMASSIDASKYVAQLTSVQSQVDKLKETAKAKADAQLNKLVDQIGDKLAAAQKKITELKNAEGGTAEALKNEVEKLMPELQKLVTQAMARVQELGVSL